MTPAQAIAVRMCARAAFRDAAERARHRTGALRRLQISAMRDALVAFDAARFSCAGNWHVNEPGELEDVSAHASLGPNPWTARDVRMFEDVLGVAPTLHGDGSLVFSLADLERAQAGAAQEGIAHGEQIRRMREEAAAAGFELERFEPVKQTRDGEFVVRPIWRRR